MGALLFGGISRCRLLGLGQWRSSGCIACCIFRARSGASSSSSASSDSCRYGRRSFGCARLFDSLFQLWLRRLIVDIGDRMLVVVYSDMLLEFAVFVPFFDFNEILTKHLQLAFYSQAISRLRKAHLHPQQTPPEPGQGASLFCRLHPCQLCGPIACEPFGP